MGTEKEAENEKKGQKVEEMEPDMHLGDILKDTGDCGLFQFGMIFFFAIILVTLTWSMLGMAFEAAIPHWYCVVANDNGTINATEAKVCNINGTACDYYEFDPDMRTIVSEWDLVCDKKWVSQTITTIQMAGLLVGGMIWGHISDGIGRKPTLFLSLFLLGVFNLLSYFSTGWQMFAVMRFFIGFASTGFMSANITFEYIRNKWRVYLNLIPTWATWAAAMAGVCYLLHDWRYLHIIIAAVSFPSLLLWFAVPESFRWLVSHGKLSDAEKVINYVARINRAPASSLSGIRKVVENEQHEAEKSKALQVYTALDLFRSNKIRKVTVLFSLIWIFSAFSYYGIAFGVQELSGNLYLNLFLVTIVDIPGNYLLVLFNVWGGRRFTSLGFYFVGGLLALAVGILQYTKLISGLSLNVLALTSKLCISAAWEINTLWAAESFPTVVRNIGNGVLSSVSRIGSIIAPQIINLSMDTPGLLYLGSGIVCLLSSGLSFFLEETKHRDLPDMLPHKHEITAKSEPTKSIQV